MRLVSNVTDIDDAIINRANRENRPWQDITTKCEAVWFEAMDKLGVARPTDVPHATEYVEQMVDDDRPTRRDRSRATPPTTACTSASSRSRTTACSSTSDLSDMLEGGGDREVFGAENKRHPADFVLWKLAKPGEPSWPSPWGEGRPGWHSECVVMSLDLLGEGFDLHCGGMDLKFPHHENERAQAVALGKRFANHWMHNGFVVDAEGEKMSKSLGNVANLLDLMEHYDPRAYRMLLLQSHYRGPVSVGQDNIDAAVNALAGLDSFASRTSGVRRRRCRCRRARRGSASGWTTTSTRPARRRCCSTPFGGPTPRSTPSDPIAASLVAAVHEICTAFGLVLNAGGDVPAEDAAKAAALDAARAAKDFATADAIRAELQAAGWTVETTKAGTTLRR